MVLEVQLMDSSVLVLYHLSYEIKCTRKRIFKLLSLT